MSLRRFKVTWILKGFHTNLKRLSFCAMLAHFISTIVGKIF